MKSPELRLRTIARTTFMEITGHMVGMLRNLWEYRHFVANSIWNDFYTRLARSKLGSAWLILQPLSQAMIYAFILSNLLSSKLPGVSGQYAYAVYLMSGLLAWNLFAEVLDRCLKIFVSNANIMKKVYFPRITLPVIAVGSALVNNMILFVVMIALFVPLGHEFSWTFLYIPLMAPIIALFAAGCGIFLGIVNVFVRDIEQAVPIVLQVLFWFTPIVYPASVIPPQYAAYLHVGPMFEMVTFYHEAIVFHNPPSLSGIVTVAVIAAVACAFSLMVFRRANADMVDVL